MTGDGDREKVDWWAVHRACRVCHGRLLAVAVAEGGWLIGDADGEGLGVAGVSEDGFGDGGGVGFLGGGAGRAERRRW